MDFNIRLGTAHRRVARPAHPSCPHLGDERRKLPARHQQEGTAAIGSGAKPKPENAKRRRPRHRNINRHGSTKINRASQPFSLNPTGTLSRRPLAHFVSAIDNLSIRDSGLLSSLAAWLCMRDLLPNPTLAALRGSIGHALRALLLCAGGDRSSRSTYAGPESLAFIIDQPVSRDPGFEGCCRHRVIS